MNQKEHNFRYSKSLLGFQSLTVVIPLALATYLFYAEKSNKSLAILFLIVGVSNTIYYATRLSNKKTQLKINSRGITLKKKFVAWHDIDEIYMDRVKAGGGGDFINVVTKKDKEYSLEITELNVSQKKLNEIISEYGDFVKQH